jgi:hydroxyethylthiazole kinase
MQVQIAEMMDSVKKKRPLVHHITNYVTVNDCANICICSGGAPVMTDEAKDIPEMVRISSAVVLNIGTLNETTVDSMLLAGKTAKRFGIPVILDPVGVGATEYRTDVAWKLIKRAEVSVIKGNGGEISVLAGMGGIVKGVDSISGSRDENAAISLASMTGAVVAATGKTDYVSDGKTTYILNNGCDMMETVSGTGCMACSVVGAYVGACGASAESVAAAISAFSIAGEISGEKAFGPGSFKTKLFDSLYNLTPEEAKKRAKISEA